MEKPKSIKQILLDQVQSGEKAEIVKDVLQPVFERIRKDCFNEFLTMCKTYYQNIDNSSDVMLKSKMMVVDEIESAINNIVRTGKDAEQRLSKEA
jgi:hypothetical protein